MLDVAGDMVAVEARRDQWRKKIAPAAGRLPGQWETAQEGSAEYFLQEGSVQTELGDGVAEMMRLTGHLAC